MVSHRPSHIRVADKVIVLQSGNVQFCGPADKGLDIALGLK